VCTSTRVRPSAALLAFVALASDVFRRDGWRDFFLDVAGVAAVFTGLVFVSMSINLDAVTPMPHTAIVRSGPGYELRSAPRRLSVSEQVVEPRSQFFSG
jgi:hypothetical protein